MIATVPTADEISGDFSMSGTTIFNPFSSHPNPNFDSTKPVIIQPNHHQTGRFWDCCLFASRNVIPQI